MLYSPDTTSHSSSRQKGNVFRLVTSAMILITGSALLTAATTTLAADELRKVRLAVDVPYPPFEYRTADGELAGFEIDLGNELCQRAALECEWVVQGWDGIIPGLLSRKYDAILSSMRITKARERQVRFTDPYAMSQKVWVARKGNELDPSTPDTLEGAAVGVQRGTTQDTYITDSFGDIVDVRRYATANDVALDMESRRLDLAFINYPVAIDSMAINDPDSDFMQIGERINSPESIFGRGNAIAVRSRDEALAERFNKALDEIYSDGTFERLMEHYFDYDLRPASRL